MGARRCCMTSSVGREVSLRLPPSWALIACHRADTSATYRVLGRVLHVSPEHRCPTSRTYRLTWTTRRSGPV
eukprot:810322-Pleurochrysis_carterae.AAC.1